MSTPSVPSLPTSEGQMAPAPLAPAPTASLGMADLAALEAMSMGQEEPSLEGMPAEEAPVGDPGVDGGDPLQSQPVDDGGKSPEELLILRKQLEDAQRNQQALADRLGKYERVEDTRQMEQAKSDLIAAFEVADPAEIAAEYMKVVQENRQTREQMSAQLQTVKASARFMGLLEAEEKHDPTFAKKVDALEKSFGLEPVKALFSEAVRQEDPIGHIKSKLTNIVLPEEKTAAEAAARTKAAQDLVTKGRAPEVPPTTGALSGSSPAPALDLDSLAQKNLGLMSVEAIAKLQESINP